MMNSNKLYYCVTCYCELCQEATKSKFCSDIRQYCCDKHCIKDGDIYITKQNYYIKMIISYLFLLFIIYNFGFKLMLFVSLNLVLCIFNPNLFGKMCFSLLSKLRIR